MESSSCSSGSGAIAAQANLAMEVLKNGVQNAPATAPIDAAARSQGMQAEGKGQKLDVVA